MARRKAPRTLALLGCGPAGRALAFELLFGAIQERTSRRAGASVLVPGSSFRGSLKVWSRSPASVRALQRGLEGFPLLPHVGSRVRAFTRPEEALRGAEVAFLAISDAALGPLARELARRPLPGAPAVVLVTSGSVPLSALAPLRRRGHPVGRLHPLCPLPPGRGFVGDAAYGIEGDPRAVRAARGLFAQGVLRGEALRLRPGKAELEAYQAGASLPSGGLVALYACADEALAGALPGPRARRAALASLLDETRFNLAELGPRAALTGALARGSEPVVARHLAALRRHPAAAEAYRALGRKMLALARARGSLDATSARRLAARLTSGGRGRE